MRTTVNEKKEAPVKGKIYSGLLGASAPVTSFPSSSALQLNLYVQELNNSAASCIEIGIYSRAVTSLKRALQLYKLQQNSRSLSADDIYKHTLDGCIISSEAASRTPKVNYYDPSDSFISNRPIKVPAQEQTPLGPALLIIVSYNLGLAYHLISMKCKNEKQRKRIIFGAIASYNRAYETQAKLLQCQCPNNATAFGTSIRSIRFKLMVINNMSQLHKLNADEANQNRCLHLLLSIMMVIVDQHVQALNSEARTAKLLRIELDGFLQSVSCLILKPKFTADVA